MEVTNPSNASVMNGKSPTQWSQLLTGADSLTSEYEFSIAGVTGEAPNMQWATALADRCGNGLCSPSEMSYNPSEGTQTQCYSDCRIYACGTGYSSAWIPPRYVALGEVPDGRHMFEQLHQLDEVCFYGF